MNIFYRVVMLTGGKWEAWTNYATYEDAELAARGLITGGKAAACHILEISSGGGRIVAIVDERAATGWPHGKAVVKRLTNGRD